MGANHEVIIVQSLSQQKVIDRIQTFLVSRGLHILGVMSPQDCQKRWGLGNDFICFVGPNQNEWVPVVGCPATLRISLHDWFVTNPLAQHLSTEGHTAIFLWSYDSGSVAGFSLFRDKIPEEARTIFPPSYEGEAEITEGVPTVNNTSEVTLAIALGDSIVDYLTFLYSQKTLPVLQFGTGALLARLGLREHLFDFDHMSRGEPVKAIQDNKLVRVPLSEGWLGISYSS